MTFNFAKSALASSVIAAALLGGSAAQAATGTGTATAKVLTPLTVTSTRDLAFGTIVPQTSASTVAVSSAGVVTCGALTCIGTRTSGQFSITGTAGQVVSITAPLAATSFTLTEPVASNTMSINNVTVSAASATLTGGTASFTVGGTLNVGANQAEGDYTGSYTVTVNYN